MDSLIEDNISFACAYCELELGTVATIIGKKTLANHACLKEFDNVNLNYETKKIYRATNELENFERSAPASSSNQSNNKVPSKLNDNVASTSSCKALTSSEIWTDSSVKLLITIYKDNKDKFTSPSFTKKKVWEIISFELNKFGYNKSGIKCDEKWRNLRKTYDKVRTEINKTGNSRVTWKFFEDFQEIYWNDPYFVPVATASSTAELVERKLANNFAGEKKDGSTKRKNLSPGEIRKTKPLFTASDIEIRKQKRHEEKMKLKYEIFEWFKENNIKKGKD